MSRDTAPDWLIWSGESGARARTMDYEWAGNITVECLQLGVAVFGNQWGQYANHTLVIDWVTELPECGRLTRPPTARAAPNWAGASRGSFRRPSCWGGCAPPVL